MDNLTQLIIQKHLVRKTKAQKKAFRETLLWELEKRGIEAKEETCRNSMKSVNVVVGDADKAQLIFGAHYDTAPRMFLPNFITPKNAFFYIVYQLLLVGLLAVAAGAIGLAVGWIAPDFTKLAFLVAYWGLLLLMMFGPANPNTYNDNTSGVATLIELMLSMDEQTRSKCAFVFFDHEEVGLVGSAGFAQMHKEAAKNTVMLNFDCVGDGEHLLLSAKQALRKDEEAYTALKTAFADGESVLYTHAAKTVYPSDQSNFKKAAAVAALKHKKGIGYYMDRIHTARDTVLEEKNVERIVRGMKAFAQRYFGA